MEQLIAATLNLENCQLWLYQGFPRGSDGKEIAFNAGDPDSMPGSGKIPPWRREWQPTPIFLPGEFHAQRSLAGYIQSMIHKE